MIVKIAVSAAVFAIDKPYSYLVPEGMELVPGQRVTVPFGRANKLTEGVVLSPDGELVDGIKEVREVLDPEPLLTPVQLKLAAFLRERYFCTFFEAIRAILPAQLWFQAKERYSLTQDLSWKEAAIRKTGALPILRFLEEMGGQTDYSALSGLGLEEHVLEEAIAYLVRKKWLQADTRYLRRGKDKTERIAVLVSSAYARTGFIETSAIKISLSKYSLFYNV